MDFEKSAKSLNIKSFWLKRSVISGTQPEVFQGSGGFVELGHFDKHFVKNKEKKSSQGKNLEFFSPRYS